MTMKKSFLTALAIQNLLPIVPVVFLVQILIAFYPLKFSYFSDLFLPALVFVFPESKECMLFSNSEKYVITL